MTLQEVLQKHRKAILGSWFELVVATYPEQTGKFLRSQKDPFANPVGSTLKRELEAIFDSLLERRGPDEKVREFLDRIIRIRAIQDFPPSAALAFVPQLKGVIRQEAGRDIAEHHLGQEVYELDFDLDRLTLLAFDIYMACREQVYQIRANEMRNLFAQVLKKSDLFCEIPTQEGLEPAKSD